MTEILAPIRKGKRKEQPQLEEIDKYLDSGRWTVVHELEKFINDRYEIRYNTSKNDFEVKLKKGNEWEELNEDNMMIEILKSGINFKKDVFKSLIRSDFVHRYDQMKDYFTSLPEYKASEPNYIDEFIKYITLKNPERDQVRFSVQLKKHLIRSVKQVFHQGYFNKHCFTVINPEQNIGKTSLIRWFCPPSLKQYYLQEFTPDKHKDNLLALCENFMINFDELSSLYKAEVNNLKAIMSANGTKTRKSYDSRARMYHRKSSFWASTNKTDFLDDETGSIRWICFEIDKINFDYSTKVNIDRLYAQIYYLYKEGTVCELTHDEIRENELCNNQYSRILVEEELITQYFTRAEDKNDENFITTTQIYNHIALQTSSKVSMNVYNVGRALKKLGYLQESRRIQTVEYPQKGYYLIKKTV